MSEQQFDIKIDIKNIDVDTIYIPKEEDDNLRFHEGTEEHITELRQTIMAQGFTHPINVHISNPEETDLPYTAEDGNRRLTILQAFKADKVTDSKGNVWNGMVPVNVLAQMDSAARLEKQITANMNHEKTKPAQYMNALVKIQRIKGETLSELVKRSGMTKKQVTHTLKALKVGEKGQELIDSGDLSLVNAVALASVKSRLPEDEFDKLLARAVKGGDLVKNKDLVLEVGTVKEDLAAKKKLAQTGEKTEYSHKPKAMTKSDIEVLHSKAILAVKEKNDVTNQVRLQTIKEILGTDDKSIAEGKAAWIADQKKKDEAAVLRKAAREKKKAEEQAELAK